MGTRLAFDSVRENYASGLLIVQNCLTGIIIYVYNKVIFLSLG